MFIRRGDATKPHLDWRVRLFVGGALLALVGMALGFPWLVWIAVGLLLAGFVVRLLPERTEEE